MNRRRAPWACWRCQSTTGRNGRLLICLSCKRAIEATGRHWCNTCQRIVDPAHWSVRTKICTTCLNATNRRARRALDGIGDPPDGWILAARLAEQLYVDHQTVVGWLRRGWPVEWRKWSRYYYIKPLATYPPAPDRRKR